MRHTYAVIILAMLDFTPHLTPAPTDVLETLKEKVRADQKDEKQEETLENHRYDVPDKSEPGPEKKPTNERNNLQDKE